jgi:hypothetical protein
MNNAIETAARNLVTFVVAYAKGNTHAPMFTSYDCCIGDAGVCMADGKFDLAITWALHALEYLPGGKFAAAYQQAKAIAGR